MASSKASSDLEIFIRSWSRPEVRCAPDDPTLNADGAYTTHVVLRVSDEFDAIRTYANDPIVFTISGPAEIIGDHPFALVGGTGAIWIRAQEMPGTVRLTAKRPRLGEQTIEFTLMAVPKEAV